MGKSGGNLGKIFIYTGEFMEKSWANLQENLIKIIGTFWENLRKFLEKFRKNFGEILEISWGNIRGIFLGYLGDFFVTSRGYLGDIGGYLGVIWGVSVGVFRLS